LAARAELLHGSNLDAAIVAVERRRRDEQPAFAISSAFGRGSRPPLPPPSSPPKIRIHLLQGGARPV